MSKHIDITKPGLRPATVLTHGLSGSGKTHFAATWPRPRFLSDVAEGGYETLYTMERSLWYEPNWIPQVRGIETHKDFQEELRLAEDDVKKGGPTAPQTIVFDSLTFLMQLMEMYYRDAYADEVRKNQYAVFNWLNSTLRAYNTRMHKLNANIVWLCLTKDKEDDGVCGPLLTGQMAQKLPATCKYILLARCVPSAKVGGEPTHELRTRPYGRYHARVRSSRMPDPIAPTYRAFAEAAGLARPVQVTPQRTVIGANHR